MGATCEWLFLCLDGLDLRCIEDHCPFFLTQFKLVKEVESAPTSPPAWYSFYTGLEPEKHGVPPDLGAREAWQFLKPDVLVFPISLRFAALGIPFSYPAEKFVERCAQPELLQLLVCGIPAPHPTDEERDGIYPPHILLPDQYSVDHSLQFCYHEVASKIPAQTTQITLVSGALLQLAHYALILEMAEKCTGLPKPQVLFLFLFLYDRISHPYFLLGDIMRKTYDELPRVVDQAIELFNPSNLALYSDHGFVHPLSGEADEFCSVLGKSAKRRREMARWGQGAHRSQATVLLSKEREEVKKATTLWEASPARWLG